MNRLFARSVISALALLASVSCASTTPQKSTGTNWIACDSDAECARFPGARCRDDGVCVDGSGKPIERGAWPDAGTGAGGSTGAGDASGAGGSISGAGTGAGGSTAAGGSASGGAAPDAGRGGTGDGGTPDSGPVRGVAIVDCYSPGQNLEQAYEPGAVGCKCPSWAPGLCVGRAALVCTEGRWQAVNDGPCFPSCWKPDDPEHAFRSPTDGCACSPSDGDVCVHTYEHGYATAACIGGKWTLEEPFGPCTCTSNAHCGFGSRCQDGACLPGQCEVDGVRYAAGVDGIPDSLSCNTCRCNADGTLSCTELPCPTTNNICPPGTTPASVCISCGNAGGCGIARTGCLPTCTKASDCANTYTPSCDPEQHACRIEGCD